MAVGQATPPGGAGQRAGRAGVGVPEGGRLVFGRGPEADLTVAAGRGLSRRAGVISALGDGVWIANISRTHALYTEGEGYRIRLPRMEDQGEPSGGWFLRSGMTLVGSRAMLDEGQPLCVMVTGQSSGWDSAPEGARMWQDGDATLLPLLPGPDDEDLPRGAHVVPSLAARPGRGEPAAAHARDRQGGPRGDRGLPRAGALRH